jgi:hypothetical protein
VLKNGNWNIQNILLAQFPLPESRIGLIAKQAQRSMLIISPTPCTSAANGAAYAMIGSALEDIIDFLLWIRIYS